MYTAGRALNNKGASNVLALACHRQRGCSKSFIIFGICHKQQAPPPPPAGVNHRSSHDSLLIGPSSGTPGGHSEAEAVPAAAEGYASPNPIGAQGTQRPIRCALEKTLQTGRVREQPTWAKCSQLKTAWIQSKPSNCVDHVHIQP